METMTVEAPASVPAATPTPVESSEPKEVRIVDEREQEARAEADLDSKLAKVFREAKRDRAEDGKFAGKEPKPAAAKAPNEDAAAKALDTKTPDAKPVEAPKVEAAKTEAPPEKPALKVEAPKHWDEKVRAKFADLPPDVAKEISDAALKDRQAITKVGEFAKNAKPIVDTVQQFRETFETKGLSYQEGLTQLLKAQRALDRDPVAGLQQIAQAYGIDLGSLAKAGGRDPHAQALQSKLEQQDQQIKELRAYIQNAERSKQEQTFNSKADLASKLASELEGFDDLIDDMEPLIVTIRRQNPGWNDEQVVKEAYDRAAWSNPTFRQRRVEAETKAAETKRAEEAKKAAEDARRAGILNVEGETGAVEPADMDQLLRATFRKSNRK
jgi:hypothetical protein